MSKYLSFVRSSALDVLTWACVVFLFAIFLAQCGRATDTGHAAFIGLRESER